MWYVYETPFLGCASQILKLANKYTQANAGDSRGVLGIKGRAKPLSEDHKPQLEAEKNRIVAAGGFVDFGRVNGNLALSRAIGDFEFKKVAELPPEAQIVTAFPDVEQHDLTDEDEFLVLACDGKSSKLHQTRTTTEMVAWLTWQCRNLGLSIVSSCCRVRPKRNRC